jgi:N4-gp56 family major capsid protein
VHVPGGNDTFVAPSVADIVASVDSASFLVEGVPPSAVELALDKDTFTGRQFGKVVSISDLAEWESPFSMADTAAEKVARWAAEIINNVAESAFVSCTNVIYAGGASAGSATSDKMTAADLGFAVARLRMAGVPQFPWGYTAILSPRQIIDLQNETSTNSWSNAVRYTDNGPLLAGEVGMFQGCRVLDGGKIIQNAATSGSGGVDILSGVVFGPEAIGLGDIGTVEVHVLNTADHTDR